MNAGKVSPGAKGASATDWRAIHGRLEAAREATERGWLPGSEETKRILRARARALAREPQPELEAADSIEVIEFVVAQEKYAFESAHVREIYPLHELTPLPCTPPFVLGIVNVRGQILSVIDIKKFFDLPQKGLTDLNKVIVLRSESMEFGVLTDLIAGTRVVPVRELKPSLPTLTGIREEYLRGVTADRTVVLDAAKLLSDPKIVVHEHVAT
ncbi:MAG: purine-binding chemotaxis protein CheW [Betaproteobacteria bacterium]|nr:MAG: purine-binding chemotaxis protein CheW [Betaproteobacteria bacterium]